jgi:HAD superfamily hydrolase (TIGR01484 family)
MIITKHLLLMTSIAFFDLDDTLSISKQPIQEAQAKSFSELLSVMKGAIVSGAKPEQMEKQIIERLPADTNLDNLYCFTQNAAGCYKYEGGRMVEVYSFPLTEEEKGHIISCINKVLEDTQIVANEPSYGERIEDRGAQITLSTLGQMAAPDIKRVWDPDQAKRKILRNLLVPMLPGFDVGIGGLTSVDITRAGINKTYAMKWTTENLGIAIEDMVYVGDALFPGGNDFVVVSTGIKTIQTDGPDATSEIIASIINENKNLTA